MKTLLGVGAVFLDWTHPLIRLFVNIGKMHEKNRKWLGRFLSPYLAGMVAWAVTLVEIIVMVIVVVVALHVVAFIFHRAVVALDDQVTDHRPAPTNVIGRARQDYGGVVPIATPPDAVWTTNASTGEMTVEMSEDEYQEAMASYGWYKFYRAQFLQDSPDQWKLWTETPSPIDGRTATQMAWTLLKEEAARSGLTGQCGFYIPVKTDFPPEW